MNTKIKAMLASVKVEDTFETRLATVLKNGNIPTLDVLLGKSDAELLKLKGFGKKMLFVVGKAFKRVGVCRSPFYEDISWPAVRHNLERHGYSEGAIGLFWEMLPKSGLAWVRRRELPEPPNETEEFLPAWDWKRS